jgi:penicillin-insensitive murein DD-endopeptidase
MRGPLIPLLALLGAFLTSDPAFGKASRNPAPARASSLALSVGSPTDGRLEGGIELVSGEGLRLKRPGRARWGLPQLVSLLERGARRVAERHPGSLLLIGDLSRRGGGDLGHHRSHESGRDADVAFYFTDRRGAPVELERFQAVGRDGKTAGPRRLTFDDARNWTLIQAWLTHPRVRVQHIFVAAPLRQRLLRHARERGVSLPLLHRAALALKEPTDGLLHDDHYHVRIACPPRQRGVCVAEPGSEREARKLAKARRSPAGRMGRAVSPKRTGSKRLLARIR